MKQSILERKSELCRAVGGVKNIRRLPQRDRLLISAKIVKEAGRNGFAAKFAREALAAEDQHEIKRRLEQRHKIAKEFDLVDLLEQSGAELIIGLLDRKKIDNKTSKAETLALDIDRVREIAKDCEINEETLKKLVQQAITQRFYRFGVEEGDGQFEKISELADAFVLTDQEVIIALREAIKTKIEDRCFKDAAVIANHYGLEQEKKKAAKGWLEYETMHGISERWGQVSEYGLEKFWEKIKEAHRLGIDPQDEREFIEDLIRREWKNDSPRAVAELAKEYGFDEDLKKAVEKMVGDLINRGWFCHAKCVAEEFGFPKLIEKKYTKERLLDIFDSTISGENAPRGRWGSVEKPDPTAVIASALTLGFATEEELAKRVFDAPADKKKYSPTEDAAIVEMAGLQEQVRQQKLEDQKRYILYDIREGAYSVDDVIRRINSKETKELVSEAQIQEALEQRVMLTLEKGDYSGAAEFAFAFEMNELLDQIRTICKSVGFELRFRKNLI
jgi:hypothetical protein